MRFIHISEIDSTNAEARRRAEVGDFGPLWISSDVQTLGKGRRGREWVSKSGNLYCTGLYPYDGDLASAAKLSFVAALAVADSLEQYIDPALIRIKWPNDVLVAGQKISGILLESGTENDQTWVAVGTGINLVNHPENTETPATHLLAHIDPEKLQGPEPLFAAKEPVLATYAARFDHWRSLYLENGFEPIQQAWTARAKGIGEPVKARLSDKTIEGIALELDETGALCVQTKDGCIVKIHAGDVFFPEFHL
ncbi:MAG: biotin--[acetyl-CoA-carboxylase] ligase [Acidimicrobiales bacterium]|nr:biotin--[acetyl-CoA-carboxylase] ligase [Hyphomonadaceae bacterium]RZV42955.1 MAG: biotin--[acetyl-CoA-carboxylase] ligase [Acidimicrobiales bacterium]